MKRTEDEELKTQIIDALYRAEGIRIDAAKLLNTSLRTLNRWIKELRLYGELEAMGWIARRGPPRADGSSEPSRIDRLYARILSTKVVNVAELAKREYGEDTLVVRASIYTILGQLTKRGLIIHTGRGKWELPGDNNAEA